MVPRWVPVVASILTSVAAGCPDLCRCPGRGRVYCNEKQLTTVPYGIPSDTKILYLQDNNIINSPEVNQRLSSLPMLEKLFLYRNELSSMPIIQSDTLRTLEVFENKISSINEGSFLPKLDILNLDDNIISNGGIDQFAFDGIGNLRSIMLNKNKLTQFPVGLPVSIETLHLNENQINEIQVDAVDSLNQLLTLQLQKNQLNDQSFPVNIFGYWTSLKQLDMSQNYLTKFPRGLQSNLEELRLSQNQMVFLSRHDFTGLTSLRHLELSYNRLRSMEAGSLESLKQLQSIDLSGNVWSCDCYLRPLKEFLELHPFHTGQRDKLVCGGSRLSGKEIDFLQGSEMTCDQVNFTLHPIPADNSVTIYWEQDPDFAPPFVQFKLRLGRLDHEEFTEMKEVEVATPAEVNFDELVEGVTYRVCLYNGYYWEQDNSSFCKEFTLGTNIATDRGTVPNQGTSTGTDTTGEVYEEVVVTTDGNNLETIIGLLTGALIVILSLIIVAVLFWRSNKFSNTKGHTLPHHHQATYNSKFEHHFYTNGGDYTTDTRVPPMYHPGQQIVTPSTMHSSNINTYQLNQQTHDAAQEFDVALVPANNVASMHNQSHQPVQHAMANMAQPMAQQSMQANQNGMSHSQYRESPNSNYATRTTRDFQNGNGVFV